MNHMELMAARPAQPISLAFWQTQRVIDRPALRTYRAARPSHRFKVSDASQLIWISVKKSNEVHASLNKQAAYEKQ
ncbi:MAG TPA: hypothetical protein VF760_08830 [Xanthobacteraceae bacterium]